MDSYKIAIFENWTFNSPKGTLNPQQLCQLPLIALDKIAVDLNTQFKQSKKKSFLDNTPDDLAKQQLDLVLDIMKTKQNIAKANRNERAVASHNHKIDKLIKEKEEDSLKDLSIAELKALKR